MSLPRKFDVKVGVVPPLDSAVERIVKYVLFLPLK